MRKITVCDITLFEHCASAYQLSFKEKVEIAKQLDRLSADVIQLPMLSGKKSDILFIHTVAPLLKNSVLSCPVELDPLSVDYAYEALKVCSSFSLSVTAPCSPMQMEYICHCKEKALLEKISATVSRASQLCKAVEFCAGDATRAESDFLVKAIKAAISAGATAITVCDSAGNMLPAEFADFIEDIKAQIPELSTVSLGVQCSSELCMGEALLISALAEGVDRVKTAIESSIAPSTLAFSDILRVKGDSLECSSSLSVTQIRQSAAAISSIIAKKAGAETVSEGYSEDFALNADDDIKTVSSFIARLGYDLSAEDIAKVYDSFKQLASKKKIGAKELDAIIASNALQVTPTYKLKSYVINTGNVISSSANIELDKMGTVLSGISLGDGPIDAAFLAIEQIIGHHYELDDFQIQAVTEGREAVGQAIVKLRSEGKLYSGRGISTDIVGASIKAYINAINKICFEEGTI